MTDNNKKKEGAYATLTGFRRAVPIILVALAVFTGLCFIMQDTGTLGQAISRLLLGLFSIGGYFIPLFLAIHAVFYASDVQKKRLLGRIIFTVLTVFTISALTHTIAFYSEAEMVFAPKEFYRDGIELHGGGFIGGILAFCITHLFGNIGLILIAVVMFALYVTYFLSSGSSVFPRIFKRLADGTKSAFSSSKREREANKKKRADKKEEKRLEELAAEQDDLTDDDFFGVESGMKEISIPALDIREVRSDADLEANPHLQEKVFHKSEVREDGRESRFDYGDSYTAPKEPERERRVNLDYSTTDSEHGLSVSVKDSVFTERDDDIIIDVPEERKSAPARTEAKREESADELFANGEFSAYDVKINEELSNRPSSKAARVENEPKGISELEKSIADITPEEVEKARQRADFEMRKRANIEAQRRYAEAQAEIARNNARAQNATERSRTFGDDNTVTFTFGTPDPRAEVRTAEAVPESTAREAYIPEYMRGEAEKTHAPLNESKANAEPTVSEVKEDPNRDEDIRRETFANAMSDYERDSFKPYTPPTPERMPESDRNEIRVSRTMLEPNPTEAYTEPYRESGNYTEYAAASSREATYSEPIIRENKSEVTYSVHGSDEAPIYSTNTDNTESEAYEAESATCTEDNTPYSSPASESNSYNDGSVNYIEPEEDADENGGDEPSGTVYPDSFDTFASNENEDDEAYASNDSARENYSYNEPSLSFDDEDDEDEEVSADPEEEENGGYEEIPPELQNSDVVAQRSMFSFLRDEDQDSDSEENVSFPERPAPYESEEDMAEDDTDEDEPIPQRSSFAERMAAMEKQRAAQTAEPEEEDDEEEDAEPERPDYSDYVFPSIDLLRKGKIEEDVNQEEEKNANAEKLVDALLQFNVRISIKAIDRGPRITRYEIVPARGVKVNSVTSLFNDIQLNLGVEGMRMEAPIPGKSAIGVEIPNKKPSNVLLRDLVESEEFISSPSKTMSCLGKDVTGNPVFADIAKMPHILIAGATGMGKSVCINAVLLSILYKAKPDEVKLIMIDPKKVEFARYNGIPHLLIPVVTDVKQAAGALMWAVEQMEKRYDLLQKLEVSKLDTYNEKVKENPSLGEPLPKIIIVIDELNDIMLQVRKPAEDLIMSIAQKARAAGIHLIIGTQRPSVDVITGVIKANIPSRISCKVASYNDSKTILEQAGAEKLLNNGDMLYIPAGAPKALRVQGAFCTDDEVSAVAKHLKSQVKGNIYDERALEEINKAAQKCQKGKGGDDIDDEDEDSEEGIGLLSDQQFLDAVEIALRSGKISTSLLQRKLRVGYSKAAMFIDNMEDLGIVGEPCGSKPREVLITKDEWHESLARRSLD